MVGEKPLLLFSNETFAASVELAWITRDGHLDQLDPIAFGTAASMHTLYCADSSCFVSAYQLGWLEIDLSEPNSPTILQHQITWSGPGRAFYEGATGITLNGGVLLIADTERGLLAYERTSRD